jgi:DMSO/TMAO reductase YedYZ molybdopterin-dependent catalytic subunit
MKRREFLVPLALSAAARPSELLASKPERSGDPLIRAFDFWSIQTFLTPNDKFFLRSHFSVPAWSPTRWRFGIVGRVRSPLELSFVDILARPRQGR